MNEFEQEQFEAELRRTKPARVPEQLLARLMRARPEAKPRPAPKAREAAGFACWGVMLRWLCGGTAVAIAALIAWRPGVAPRGVTAKPESPPGESLKADGVEVDQKLVSSFDTVAQLPGGEPIRFRVRKWRDHVVLSDKARGVVIDHSNPRVEVVPIRFETY